MRILIVRLGAFGDIVHTLPLAAELHAAGHRLGWLAEDRWHSVLEGNPAIERIHLVPRRNLRDRVRPWHERLGQLATLVRDLRRADYDLAIDAQGLAKSALFSVLSAAPWRIGHGHGRAREGAAWIAHRTLIPRSIHVIDQQRDLARLVGIDPRGPWRFPLPAWTAERTWAAAWLAGHDLTRPWILNVGAGWPTKVWPVQRHAELLAKLRFLGHPTLVAWGSAAERTLAEQAIAQGGHGVLAPSTSIPQLAGLLAHGRVMVSGDTGPLHLALALGTPAVGLFGPVPAERNGPRGPGYRNLQAPGAAWERHDLSKVDMGAIGADTVADTGVAIMAEVDRLS